MAPKEDTKTLEHAFKEFTDSFNEGNFDKHWALFHEDSVILDEDIPWRFSKADQMDHINFHLTSGGKGLWESAQWVPREMNVLVIGDTGHISGFSTMRGKPRDAGFRQRFMGFTQTWVRGADGSWLMLCWHQSVLAGRIEGASPS